MAWPTPQDYNEAVQNPPYTFSDPELQGGSSELTALGLPKPITGNFASVYRMRGSGGDWAVRCFWRELSDMQARYSAISAHLRAAGLPYTVGFEYQPEGIRVRGTWYPILKMEWVQGELLNDFLLSHLHDPVALRSLAERWIRMVGDLERAGCAHGDLQHGNVLVVDGELKLVDYDGMYVPALAGMGSHELGQQHYQHPQRGASDFGPYLDRFSAWVIHLSICGLAADPSLWDATRAGDERLLFQRQDFVHPSSSAALALLTGHADPDLRTLALQFRVALGEPLVSVPSLWSAVHAAVPQVDRGELPATGVPSSVMLLWRSLAPSAAGETPMSPPPTGSHPAWVRDHLPPRVEEPITASREAIGFARVSALVELPLTATGAIGLMAMGAPVIVAVVLLVLVWGVGTVAACILAYRQGPEVRVLRPLVAREVHAVKGILRSERAIRTIAANRESLRRKAEHYRNEAAGRRTELQQQERARTDGLRASLSESLQSTDLRLREVDRREAEDEQRMLEESQQRYITNALRRATLRTASLPGLGPAAKMRLWTLGVWAAADVSSERIKSMQRLDHDQLMQLVTWRVETETTARRTMPRRLPPGIEQSLRDRYRRRRDPLLAERARTEASFHASLAELQAAFVERQARVDERCLHQLEGLERQCAGMEARLADLTTREHEHRQALDAVRQEMQAVDGCSFRSFARTVFLPWLQAEQT